MANKRNLIKKTFTELALLSFIFSSLGLNNLAYAYNDDSLPYGDREDDIGRMPEYNLELELHPPQWSIPEDPASIELNLPEQLNLEAIAEPEINTLIEALKNDDPQVRLKATYALFNLIYNPQVSDSIKQGVIDSLEKIVTDESLDHWIKAEVLTTLGIIGIGLKASDFLREKVSVALRNIAIKSLDENIGVMAVEGLVNIALNPQTNLTIKEEIVNYLVGLTAKNLGTNVRVIALTGLRYIYLTLDYRLKVALKEKIAETHLALGADENIDSKITVVALTGLGYIALDISINTALKERIADLLSYRATKGSDSQIKESAVAALVVIARSFYASAALKERIANPLLEIFTKSADIEMKKVALTGLVSIALESKVNAALKEEIGTALLEIAAKGTDVNMMAAALKGLRGVAQDPQVNAALKEAIGNFLLSLDINSLDVNMKVNALRALSYVALHPQLNADLKERIFGFLLSLVTDENLGAEPIVKNSALSGLADMANSQGVSAVLKEKVFNLFLNIATKGTDVNMRVAALKGLAGIAADLRVNPALKEKLCIQMVGLAIKESLGGDIRLPALGVLVRISRDLRVDGSVRKYIKETISTLIKEEYKFFWEGLGVLVLNSGEAELSAEKLSLIYNVLGSLPLEMRPTVIVTKVYDTDIAPLSGFDLSMTVIILFMGRDNDRNRDGLLLKSMYLNFLQLTPRQFNEQDRLWRLSKGIEDYYQITADTESFISWDFMLMSLHYTKDTAAVFDRASSNANNGHNILLQKYQLIADVFAHTATLADGTQVKATYVFKVNDDGSITRKEVALTEQVINGKTYLLPDFNHVYITNILY